MSSAATEAPPAEAPKSKKKLIVILAVLLLVLGGSGAGVLVYLQQQKAKALAEEDEEQAAPKAAAAKEIKKDPKAAPPFFAMEPFTVNLADRDGSRYAQISVSLELDDAKTVDLIKGYLPAIRSSVLLLLSSKTSAELMDAQGKVTLARDIQREVLKPLGVEMEDPEDEESVSPKKKRKPRPAPQYPVRAVHFSNFIVQ